VIPRYRLPEMEVVWSDETRLANWLEICGDDGAVARSAGLAPVVS